MPKRYAREFRREVCERLLAGEKVGDVAAELGVLEHTAGSPTDAPIRDGPSPLGFQLRYASRRWSMSRTMTVRELSSIR
jgi:hypothetical protein